MSRKIILELVPNITHVRFCTVLFGLSEDCCVGERIGGGSGLIGLGREDVLLVVSVVGDVGKVLVISISSVSTPFSIIGGGNESRANTFSLRFVYAYLDYALSQCVFLELAWAN